MNTSYPFNHKLTQSCFLYRRWLLDKGSLTKRIQQRCANFSVRLVRQGRAQITFEERQTLNVKTNGRTFVREVFLYCNDCAVVFAHTALAESSLRGNWRGLAKLGNRPLGAALFADPKIKRAPLHFKKLTRHHPLYAGAVKQLQTPPAHLWARRSRFELHGQSILVTEVFLPGILELRP